MKRCPRCDTHKPLSEFGSGGKASYCKPCQRAYNAERYRSRPDIRERVKEQRSRWVAENPERAREISREWKKRNQDRVREGQLLRLYGINLEQYDAFLQSQGGGCAGCEGGPKAHRKYLDVDHCHDSKEVRGLLCNDCNLVIGKVNDDPAILRRLADYLEGATT